MAKKSKTTKPRKASRKTKGTVQSIQGTAQGILGTLLKFAEENPQVALAIAFEIGALINEATRSRGNVKNMLVKQFGKGLELLPKIMAGFDSKVPPALKILAGPALQAALVAGGTPKARKKVRRK